MILIEISFLNIPFPSEGQCRGEEHEVGLYRVGPRTLFVTGLPSKLVKGLPSASVRETDLENFD